MDHNWALYETFGYGNKLDQDDHLRKLPADDQSKINRVVNRLQFANTLHYRMTPQLLFDHRKDVFLDLDLGAFELYLLCTCIDVLATEDVFFDEWIAKRPKRVDREGRDKAISGVYRGKIAGKPMTESLLREAAASLYQCYLKEYGNKEGFYRFFRELPQPGRDVLLNRFPVVLRKGTDDQPTDDELERWNSLSKDEQLNHIAQYFYKYRRCEYTHDAISGPPDGRVTSRIRESEAQPFSNEGGSWDNGSFWFPRFTASRYQWYEKVSNQRRIHETDLLRMAIFFHVRNKFGYEIKESQVAGYLKWLGRQEILVSFARELYRNLELAQFYERVHGYQALADWARTFPLPEFATKWGEHLLQADILYIQYPLERGIANEVTASNTMFMKVNEAIAGFNSKHPYEQNLQEPERSLRDSAYAKACEDGRTSIAKHLNKKEVAHLFGNISLIFRQPPQYGEC